jgi:hypothetical protein
MRIGVREVKVIKTLDRSTLYLIPLTLELFDLSKLPPAMSNLTQEQIKVLEQSRQRLVQLTRSLGSLIASLNQSDPLPPW